MKITAHFRSEEFVCHDGAHTPYPSAWIASRLLPLCEVLEALRDALDGNPVVITSGYRTEGYNRSIGGARASQHTEGRAADIRVLGVDVDQVHATALLLHNEGMIRLGGLGSYPRFTHIDVRPGDRLARWSGPRVTA